MTTEAIEDLLNQTKTKPTRKPFLKTAPTDEMLWKEDYDWDDEE